MTESATSAAAAVMHAVSGALMSSMLLPIGLTAMVGIIAYEWRQGAKDARWLQPAAADDAPKQ